MALPSTRTHVAAVIAALETAGKPVGHAETPSDPGNLYYIVDPQTQLLDGPLTGDHRWARFAYQVRYIATTPEGVERLRDWARTVLLDATSYTIADRTVLDVDLEVSNNAVSRDEDLRERTMFYTADRFVLHTDPA